MDILNEKIREKNLKAFQKECGYIPEEYDYSKELYKVEIAKNGQKVLYVRNHKTDNYIRMNSTFSPEYEADRWGEKFEFDHMRTTVVFLGISSGYYIRALIKKMRADTMFVIYEPNEELLRFILDNIDISDLFEHNNTVFITSHMGTGIFYSKLRKNIVGGKIQAKAIITPGYAYNDEFVQICKQISVINMMNVNYQKFIGRDNLKNTYYSYHHLNENKVVYDMKKEFENLDIPAIIVAAGPSLNKNVDELKKAKGKALIIAVDRSVSTLQKHGIEPDLLATVDAKKSPKFLDYDVTNNKYMITAFGTNIETQKKFKGRMIYIHAGTFFTRIPGMNEKVIYQPDIGGSVATAAFLTCIDIGIKNIILVGQDLAMLGDESHADGSNEGASVTTKAIEVKGVYGGTVKTYIDWMRFKSFFENKIALNPDIRVIDATQGGAYIEGTEVIDLADIIQELCTKEFDVSRILDEIPYAQTKEEYAQTEIVIKDWIQQLELIKNNSIELSTITEQLYKICRYGDITDRKNKKKIEKFDRLRIEILNQDPMYAALTENWFEELYQIPDYVYYIRNNKEGLAAFKNSNDFYKIIPDYCDSLIDMIKEVFEIS